MNLLILKGFNNYFNRKIKKYSDLQDYIANSNSYYDFSDVNFNPNDGVATSQIIGSENQQQTGGPEPVPLMWEVDGSPDYLIAYTQETIDETVTTTIHSRWFVMESVRTRNGQYRLALKRDVIADNLERILTNPCFIEKGYVDKNNPLIFNDEGISLNQIKHSPEYMLKDATGCPWIVIYISRNFPSAEMNNPYMIGNAPNKFLAITAKTTSDTGQAIQYTDLPWIGEDGGIEPLSPDTAIPSTYTRRIAAQGEINISPIVSSKYYVQGVTYLTNPYRINFRHYFRNNEWLDYKDDSTIQKIGTNVTINNRSMRSLKRKNIRLTPSDTNLEYRTGKGLIVPSLTNDYQFDNDDSINESIAQTAWREGGLHGWGTTSLNKEQIRTYLNQHKTYYEQQVSHSPVPGNPFTEAFVGGPQAFLDSSEILKFNGKIVTNDGENFYKIKITKLNKYARPTDYFRLNLSSNIVTSSNNYFNSYLWDSSIVNPHKNSNNTMVETFFEHYWFDIKYEPVGTETLRCKIMQPESTDRIHANEVAYDMICLPYGSINFKISDGGVVYDRTSQAQASIGIARGIAAAAGDALYDMQLLPFCPYLQAAEEYGNRAEAYEEDPINNPLPYIDLTNTINQKLYSGCWFKASPVDISKEDPAVEGWPFNTTPNHEKDFVDPKNKDAVTFGLWCYSTHGTFNITRLDSGSDSILKVSDLLGISDDMTSEDIKEYSACKKFRLVSPNYTSIFDFNPLKNDGVSYFNVDFNYKPYNPYIHINPNFNYLYGDDTNDQRGLILSGDFSVGYYSSAWANYQIQNANYNDIFNRQIANIDFNQRQEREKFELNKTVGWITEPLGLGGGIQGAKAFSGLGPWGMLGGGIGGTIGGTIAHGVGTYYDEKWMNEAMAEERSYAIDNYNMALGNVKAQPYSLAKSDTLTENFKFFPFIEVYDCTDKEKEIFRNKLKYDGMTVGAIGSIQEYLPLEGPDWDFQMLKGRMIMAENIADDFHIADAIYAEVNKGFYYVNPYVEPEPEDEGE